MLTDYVPLLKPPKYFNAKKGIMIIKMILSFKEINSSLNITDKDTFSFQSRKTSPDMTEKLLTGTYLESN